MEMGDSRKVRDWTGAGGVGLTFVTFTIDKLWKNFPLSLLVLLLILGIALILFSILVWAGVRLPARKIPVREGECDCRTAMNKWGDPALLQARNSAFDAMHESGNQRVLKERQLKEVTRRRPAVSGAPIPNLTQEDEVRLQVELVIAQRAQDSAQTMYGVADKALADDIVEKLETRELVATGLKALLEAGVGQRLIPAAEWRVLKLDIERDVATSGGLTYSGIRIRKA